MKLIRNKPYSSLFAYSPGIDNPHGWTELNPAVFDVSYSTNQQGERCVSVPRFVNLSQQPVYFVFMANAGIDYVLHVDSDGHARMSLYDYLDYSSSDLRDGVGWLVDGEIGGENSVHVRMDAPTEFIVRVAPVDEYSIGGHLIRVAFSNPPAAFDYSPHYVRDWGRRIDGSCWNIAGKVYDSESLSGAGRRSIVEVVPLEAWKHGVYGTVVDYGEVAGGSSELKGIFDGADGRGEFRLLSFSYDSGDEDNSSHMYQPFGVREAPFAAKLETLLYVESSETARFRMVGTGEAQVEVNGFSQYCQLSRETAVFTDELVLHAGYNRIVVYYNSGKDGAAPVFGITKNGVVIPSNMLFLPNDFDIDEHIPFSGIYDSDTVVRFEYEEDYVQVRQQLRLMMGSFLNGEHTFGMMFRYGGWDESYDGKRTLMMHHEDGEDSGMGRTYSGVNVWRTGADAVEVERYWRIPWLGEERSETVQLVASHGVWHSLALVGDNTMTGWYLDMNSNGIRNISAPRIGDYSHWLEFGGQLDAGGFDLMNVVVSNRIFRQGEINRIFQNMRRPD